MKPTTKLEKQVAALAVTLPKITNEQRDWFYLNALDYHATISRNRMFCLECGHKWDPKCQKWHMQIIDGTCPNCQKQLKMMKNDYQTFEDGAYCAVITVKDDFQVVRIFEVSKHMAKKKPAKYQKKEVVQYWINSKGRITYFGRIPPSGYYGRNWNGAMEIRVRHTAEQSYNPKIYKVFPKMNIHPMIKRNGFKRSTYDLKCQHLFSALLTDNKIETLLKTNQIHILKHFIQNGRKITDDQWTALKVCIKQNYKIPQKSVTDYLDYIELAVRFGRDIKSPKYACPVSIDREHEKYLERLRKINIKEKYEENKAEIEELEPVYFEKRSMLFDLKFNGPNKLEIQLFTSIKQVLEEGDFLRHCVFTNGYHKESDNLLFSARIDGIPIETAQFSIRQSKVIQCRGKGNKPSVMHKDIVQIIDQNAELILKTFKAPVAKPKATRRKKEAA